MYIYKSCVAYVEQQDASQTIPTVCQPCDLAGTAGTAGTARVAGTALSDTTRHADHASLITSLLVEQWPSCSHRNGHGFVVCHC